MSLIHPALARYGNIAQPELLASGSRMRREVWPHNLASTASSPGLEVQLHLNLVQVWWVAKVDVTVEVYRGTVGRCDCRGVQGHHGEM